VTRAVALALLAAQACASPAGMAALPVLVDVQRGELVLAVEVTGELEAIDSSDVKPPALRETSNFKLSWLAADGSDVKQGDPLAKLEPDELTRSLEAARSDLAEAEQRLARRREEVAHARRDDALRLLEAEAAVKKAALRLQLPDDLVASIELRSQRLDSELAQLALAQARTATAFAASSDAADLRDLEDTREAAARRIDELERSLARLTVVAPRAGTIVLARSYQGDKRKLGDTIYRSDTIAQVVGLDSMIGSGVVDEVEVGKLATAQPVTLRLDALPDLELRGSLQAITATVQPRSAADPSKVVRVTLALAALHGVALRPGMPFRGRIELRRLADVVQLPPDAVFVAADGPIAYREVAGGLEPVRLSLGARTADALEVTSGLSAGDRVSRLAPGEGAP